MNCNEIILRVPGSREYAVVLRTALGGVAILKDFSIETLDDLRCAADEACECLLNQGPAVRALEMRVKDCECGVTVTLAAEYECDCSPDTTLDLDVTRAVLETLIPQVSLDSTPCGCVSSIGMTLLKTAV